QVADSFGGVLDKGLFEENILGEPGLHLTFGNLLEDVGRLTGACSLGLGDFLFLLDNLGGDIFTAGSDRVTSGNLHAVIAQQRCICTWPVNLQQHADTAVVVGVAAEQS